MSSETYHTSAVRVVLVTFPNLDVARQIGTHLVESQLIACINLLPAVESIYRWEGRVISDQEVLGIIKTTVLNLAQVEAVTLELHPYATPEFIVLEVTAGSERYLDWVTNICRQ